MDTHLHLHLDPQGFDLSKFMHSINVSYVIYYNRKHKRHGHVFQGRYESRVVSSDSYNLAVSAYIHNNPKDVEGYRDRVHDYPFSWMSTLSTGARKDYRKLVDTGFVLGLLKSQDERVAVKRYVEFAVRHLDTGNVKGIMQCIARSGINITHDERKVIIERQTWTGCSTDYRKTGIAIIRVLLELKYQREAKKARSFLAFVLRALCGLGYKELCANIGNMSMAGVSRLCSVGFRLYTEELQYRELFQEIANLVVNVSNC